MKYFFLAGCIAMFSLACNNPKGKDAVKDALVDSTNFTTIEWRDTLINFGSIKQGDKKQIKFFCKNTGNKPLILVNVSPTCGCTIAYFTKEPIAPGAEGVVTAEYSSGHSCGMVTKTIIARANTKIKAQHNLMFTGVVTGCEPADKVVEPHAVPEKTLQKPNH